MWDEEKLIVFFLRKKKSISITSSHTDILKFHVMNFITIFITRKGLQFL